MQAIQNYTASIPNPIPYISKQAVRITKNIAFIPGLTAISFYVLNKLTSSICVEESTITNLVCFNVGRFISMSTLRKLEPIVNAQMWLKTKIEQILPPIFLDSLINRVELAKQKQKLIDNPFAMIFFQKQPCDLNLTKAFAIATSEEIILRGGVQKIFLPIFFKLFPQKIGNLLNSAPSRILLTAFLFTLCHFEAIEKGYAVINQFLSGIAMGALTEYQGIYSSILFHFFWNFYGFFQETPDCQKHYFPNMKSFYPF